MYLFRSKTVKEKKLVQHTTFKKRNKTSFRILLHQCCQLFSHSLIQSAYSGTAGHTCGHVCNHSPAASMLSLHHDLIQSSHSSAVAALFHWSLVLMHGKKHPHRATVLFSNQQQRQSCIALLTCWTQSQGSARHCVAMYICTGWGDDEASRGSLSACRTRRVRFVSVVLEHRSVFFSHSH